MHIPCITYGILYVGITPPGLQRCAPKSLLCIEEGWKYGTCHWHDTCRLLLYLSPSEPYCQVSEMWTQAFEGLIFAVQSMPPYDIVYQTNVDALHRSRSAIDRLGSGPVP